MNSICALYSVKKIQITNIGFFRDDNLKCIQNVFSNAITHIIHTSLNRSIIVDIIDILTCKDKSLLSKIMCSLYIHVVYMYLQTSIFDKSDFPTCSQLNFPTCSQRNRLP